MLSSTSKTSSPPKMTRRSSKLITLFCIIDGQPSSSAFGIRISNGFNVDDLKTSIKTKQYQLPFFKNVQAVNLRLWKVLIDETLHNDKAVLLSEVVGEEKKVLMSTDHLSTIFPEPPREGYIHVIIQDMGPAPNCHQDQGLALDEVTNPDLRARSTVKVINTSQRALVPSVQGSVSDITKLAPEDISTAPPEDKPLQHVKFYAQDPAPCVVAVISNDTSKHDHSVNSIIAEASYQSEQVTPDPSDAVIVRTLKLKRIFSFMEENTGDTPEQDIIPCSSRAASSTKRVCLPPQKYHHDDSVDYTTADEASNHSEQGTIDQEQDNASSSMKNTCFPDQDRRESSERMHLIHEAQDAIRKLDQKRRRAILDLLQNSIERNGPGREQASNKTLERLENAANALRRHLRDIIDRIEKINKWLQRAEDLDT